MTDEDRITRLVHYVDDLEKARTIAVRALDQAEAMLSDALHALRNGSLHITDEYLDRTIDDLRAARKRGSMTA
jgi:hypothetical protein